MKFVCKTCGSELEVATLGGDNITVEPCSSCMDYLCDNCDRGICGDCDRGVCEDCDKRDCDDCEDWQNGYDEAKSKCMDIDWTSFISDIIHDV